MSDVMRQEYKALSDEKSQAILRIKGLAHDLYREIDSNSPTRENRLALTKLEESVMWAVKGLTG